MKTLLKRVMAAVLLLAFAGAPSLARAETINAAPVTPASVADGPGKPPSRAAPGDAAPSETASYAAREAAAPELGNFRGGDAVFIGGGTVLLVLIIVLIILVL